MLSSRSGYIGFIGDGRCERKTQEDNIYNQGFLLGVQFTLTRSIRILSDLGMSDADIMERLYISADYFKELKTYQ